MKSSATSRSRMSRRLLLRGFGGATLALPFLETFAPRKAGAEGLDVDPFAIFLRQANGVAAAQNNDEIGSEPERFWPRNIGALTEANLEGRALDELRDHASRLLVVKNVNMESFDYGDGHARGALQCLTARGPVVSDAGGDSEADGESLDHRIGRELNPPGQESLFLYAGRPGGWLGGPCISYRSSNNRRSAINDPWNAYQTMVGATGGLSPEAIARLRGRNESVNDLVRGQLQDLLKHPGLSARDRDRLDLHLTAVRDLETSLSCRLTTSAESSLEAMDDDTYESSDGDEVLATVRAHMDVAVLAVACGFTRSVAIQVGNGNDGATRYHAPDGGGQLENYHYISHRRLSHDSKGSVIENSDLLHHYIDRQFAQTFKYLLDRLEAYDLGDGSLLERGVSIWHNDLGNGPGHSSRDVPYVLAGSAGGFFKQGRFIELSGDNDTRNHARLLNTVATAVGVRTEGKDLCDDFGDPDLNREPHPDLMA